MAQRADKTQQAIEAQTLRKQMQAELQERDEQWRAEIQARDERMQEEREEWSRKHAQMEELMRQMQMRTTLET